MTLQIPVKMLFHRSLQTEPVRDRQPSPSSLQGQVGQFKLIDLRGLKLTGKLFKIARCWRAVSPAHSSLSLSSSLLKTLLSPDGHNTSWSSSLMRGS